MFNNIPDICTPNQPSFLTCPHNQVYYTASAIWYVCLSFQLLCLFSMMRVCRGLIGPTRQFGKGTLYYPELYAIIVGAFLPVPFWLWQRRYPNSWVRFVSTPVVLNGVSYIPPAAGINYSAWFAVGFVFQYLIRKRNFAWWSKFNYVTSAALDSGMWLPLPCLFFSLTVGYRHCSVIFCNIFHVRCAFPFCSSWPTSIKHCHSFQKVASISTGGETPSTRKVRSCVRSDRSVGSKMVFFFQPRIGTVCH